MVSEELLLKHYSELLTQRVSELLTSRLERLFPPRSEAHSIRDEISIVLEAAKGKHGFWRSVFDVAVLLMEKDYTVREMSTKLPYNPATIFKALGKLEKRGFCVSKDGLWTINETNCPIFYWHTHDLGIVMMSTK